LGVVNIAGEGGGLERERGEMASMVAASETRERFAVAKPRPHHNRHVM